MFTLTVKDSFISLHNFRFEKWNASSWDNDLNMEDTRLRRYKQKKYYMHDNASDKPARLN